MLLPSGSLAESRAAEETYRPEKDLLPILLAELKETKDHLARIEKALAEVRESKIRTPKELDSALSVDATGKSTSSDALDDFPEVSAFSAYDFGSRKIVTGIGVEIFARGKNWRQRSKRNRRGEWKWELDVADSFVAISGGKITVPVINFRVGPFVGYNFNDKNASYGLSASIFDF